MRLSFFLLIAALHVNAKGHTQLITLVKDKITIKEALTEINKQAGYSFIGGKTLLENAPLISLSLKNATITEAMDQCLKGLPYDYAIQGRIITIQPKAPPIPVPQAADTSLLPYPPGKMEVHGVVYNESGQPLSGANVVIKETRRITTTNAKGEFKLPDVPGNSTLLISFVGYKPQEVKVKSATVMQIYLMTAKNELDKIVVQAYGNTTQRFNTGNIGTVTAKEIADQPIINPLTVLQGKIPGLVVQQTNGYASAPFKVELRGRTQLDPSRPSEPLYIVDGVPLTVLESGKGNSYGGPGNAFLGASSGFNQNGLPGPAGGQSPMFSINPSDIESITVLKDADATAIYGSRGANGVIIINTKTGQAGKAKLEAVFYQGISQVTNHYDMLNTDQYLAMRREAYKNAGLTPTLQNAYTTYDLLLYDQHRYTDLQKFVWGHTGKTTDVQLALSGGDKQTVFRIAGGFHRETDITAFSGASQKVSVQTNLTHKSLDQRLNTSFTTSYSYVNINLINLPPVARQPPNIPDGFKPDGSINWAGWAPAYNPFGILRQPYSDATSFLNSNLKLKYELVKGLSASANFGYSTVHHAQFSEAPIASKEPKSNPTGTSEFGNNNNSNAVIEPLLEYKRTISKGVLTMLVGGSYQSALQTGNKFVGYGYTNDNLLGSITNAPVTSAEDNADEYHYVAGFARVNYNWADKYILNLSGRRDGSSRFGPGKQFGNFGAIGAAWIFSEEKLIKEHLSFLSFGKLRGSYGITGSDNIGDYGFLTAWSSGSVNTYIPGLPAYIPLHHANPDLQWQVNQKLEAAIDLGFLKDRLTMNVSWYRNISSNELIGVPLPVLTGFINVLQNWQATILNTGLEGTLSARLVDKSDFSWSLNFNIGINRNKLLAYPNLEKSPYYGTFVVGQPLSIVRTLHYTGIDPLTGQYVIEDKNHNGVINRDPTNPANDLYPVNLAVKYEGGFGSNLKYKNLTLNLFFRFRNWTVPAFVKSIGQPGYIGNNMPTFVLNRWQKPGDNAGFARFIPQGQVSDGNFSYSDGGYTDGSYIRLQNVALYDLPAGLMKKIGVQGCRLSCQGQNLFLLTKYPGIDPDFPYFGAMPPAKIFTAGLHFTL